MRSEWVESAQGPRRKYYALTASGRRLFDELRPEFELLACLVQRKWKASGQADWGGKNGHPEPVAAIATDYLERVKAQLGPVPAREQEEFLREIQSHVYEAYEQTSDENDVAGSSPCCAISASRPKSSPTVCPTPYCVPAPGEPCRSTY